MLPVCSKDCFHWGLLTPASEESKEKAKIVTGRFTGDPSYIIEHRELKRVGDGEDETEEEQLVIV